MICKNFKDKLYVVTMQYMTLIYKNIVLVSYAYIYKNINNIFITIYINNITDNKNIKYIYFID